MSGASATVFNHDYRPRERADTRPTPYKRVVIVGGGSAGWMAAMMIGDALLGRGAEITVLESPTVGIIGVGEGSTPWLRGFFDRLGIEESEWMPACHATYKCGISFDGWCTKPGFERYFHPFASMLDNLTMPQFVHNVEARVKGLDVPVRPERYFIAARLADERRGPRPAAQFPFDVWYGYHFDAVLLGQFLQRKAMERGVRHRSCHVASVERHENGDLAAVVTNDGERIEADFFVDCSGFGGLLIQKALATPYVSFSENLFNDAAVAMPTPIDDDIPSHTVSDAMRHGWTFKIPLTHRYGNGYVYSSAFCSADEAERELRERLGLLDSKVEARHLKMRTGRVTQHWNRNCLAVGLSQGFIEPLEATALLFVQRTLQAFVDCLEAGTLDDADRAAVNARLNEHLEGPRDNIVTHYKTNTRTDTEYWRANAANDKLSAPLTELLGLWLSRRSIAGEIKQQRLGKGYPVFSWYCLLAGMGLFPEDLEPGSPDAAYPVAPIENLLARSAPNFPKQRELLARIPPRNREPALQIYFW